MHSLAVDEEFKLFARNVAAETEVLDRKLVLAIGGKVVANQHSAAGAKRQTFDVLILRRIARRNVGRFRRRLPIADRHAGDPRRRRRIGFQQRRRDRQRTRDVVKASGRIVRRQKRRGIDLEIQQVADGIGVFGAVQTMENDGSRIRRGSPLCDRFPFPANPGALRIRPEAAASCPAAASRRREVCARLFPTTPGDRPRW